MNEPLNIFDKKRFPTIRVYSDHLEIKRTDSWTYQSFKYENLKNIRYYDPNDNWYTRILLLFSGIINQLMAGASKYRYLKILTLTGGSYRYTLPGNIDLDLIRTLELINDKANKDLVTTDLKNGS